MTEVGKKLSCGIVMIDKDDRMLMLHSASFSHWDIPKGTQSEGETPLETAIRETHEETGIMVDTVNLVELGLYHYNRFKDLWLFFARVDQIDLSKLTCTSMFIDDFGSEVPEAEEFRMLSLDEVEPMMCYSMKLLFEHELRRDIEIEMLRANTVNIQQ